MSDLSASPRTVCGCACGCKVPLTAANRAERLVVAGERDWDGSQLTSDILLIVCAECAANAVEPEPGQDFSCARGVGR